jgi:hypothetical protein
MPILSSLIPIRGFVKRRGNRGEQEPSCISGLAIYHIKDQQCKVIFLNCTTQFVPPLLVYVLYPVSAGVPLSVHAQPFSVSTNSIPCIGLLTGSVCCTHWLKQLEL